MRGQQGNLYNNTTPAPSGAMPGQGLPPVTGGQKPRSALASLKNIGFILGGLALLWMTAGEFLLPDSLKDYRYSTFLAKREARVKAGVVGDEELIRNTVKAKVEELEGTMMANARQQALITAQNELARIEPELMKFRKLGCLQMAAQSGQTAFQQCMQQNNNAETCQSRFEAIQAMMEKQCARQLENSVTQTKAPP